jgi:hypothetical protein
MKGQQVFAGLLGWGVGLALALGWRWMGENRAGWLSMAMDRGKTGIGSPTPEASEYPTLKQAETQS